MNSPVFLTPIRDGDNNFFVKEIFLTVRRRKDYGKTQLFCKLSVTFVCPGLFLASSNFANVKKLQGKFRPFFAIFTVFIYHIFT